MIFFKAQDLSHKESQGDKSEKLYENVFGSYSRYRTQTLRQMSSVWRLTTARFLPYVMSYDNVSYDHS